MGRRYTDLRNIGWFWKILVNIDKLDDIFIKFKKNV